MNKTSYSKLKIISLSFGHNSTVSYLEGGRIIFSLSEERLTQIKNFTGFPDKALKLCVDKYLKGDINNVDYFVLPTDSQYEFNYYKKYLLGKGGRYHASEYYHEKFNYLSRFSDFETFKLEYLNVPKNPPQGKIPQEMVDYICNRTGILEEKLIYLNHHLCHAAVALPEITDKPLLTFTLDSSGDWVGATVSILDKNGVNILSKNPRHISIGNIYSETTAFLGLRPNEHEFKVMGLAPYSKESDRLEVYEKVKDFIRIDNNGNFTSYIPTEFFKYHLILKLGYHRFDSIAGGIQHYLEQLVTEWVKFWIDKTSISNIALGGGVFMNVKLNQRIMEMKEVKKLYVIPSAGDESLSLGACYYTYFLKTGLIPKKLEDLYLGKQYSKKEIEQKVYKFKEDNFKIEKPANIEKKVAKLLVEGEIVAIFNGKDEWGARALGNRSIIANPMNKNVIKKINESVKNRDFWMPFTPSILEDHIEEYIVNPKKVEPNYMVISFDSTKIAQENIPATLHPYDDTLRPQSVKKDWNPRYYNIIKEFYNLTNVAGILNTSLNLHGKPNAYSFEDLILIMKNSKIKYALFYDYLIVKNES